MWMFAPRGSLQEYVYMYTSFELLSLAEDCSFSWESYQLVKLRATLFASFIPKPVWKIPARFESYFSIQSPPRGLKLVDVRRKVIRMSSIRWIVGWWNPFSRLPIFRSWFWVHARAWNVLGMTYSVLGSKQQAETGNLKILTNRNLATAKFPTPSKDVL